MVGSVSQKLPHPHPSHYVGKGKLEEIIELKTSLQIDVVLFDDELTPAQLRHLEDALDTRIIDRTALILDIFARRAQTHEGRLQVELAQLKYRLPRLTRMWTHLSRQGVGGVGLRGPGETQLEVDRRTARQRIALIEDQLQGVHRHRELYRNNRRRSQVPIIALVGYTNAGKSTLLNQLVNADVLAENKLFATLDPTTRQIRLPSGREALVTDTVGFINNLPTMLVAAFRATLEEILEASLIVHVLDVTHERMLDQARTVREILEELGADNRPVINALNKVDRMQDGVDPLTDLTSLGVLHHSVPISALTGAGVYQLLERIDAVLAEEQPLADITVLVPFDKNKLVELFHRRGHVEQTDYQPEGTVLSGRLPQDLLPRFAPYRVGSSNGARPSGK